MAAVVERLPALEPWVRPWLAAAPAHVCPYVGGDPLIIHARRGLGQGDPLSNLVSPLALAGPL
eukprot:14720638-Alexandrium_andersonii.AAC.1